MLNGLGDLGNLMKLQNNIKSMQKQLKKMTATSTSKDSLVTATVNGEFEIVDMVIDENILTGKSAKEIQNSCKEAVNNAVKENKRIASEKMKELTGGMNIPGLGNLF